MKNTTSLSTQENHVSPEVATSARVNRTLNRRHQGGFAIWVIFAVIALIAAIGTALAVSSRSSTSSTASDVQSTYVSAILSQASGMKQGLDHMVVNGSSLSALTFTQAATANDLFGSGNATLATAPDKAFTAGTASPWVFYAPGSAAAAAGAGLGATITGVGNAKNWLAILKGLTLAACIQANQALTNVTYTAATIPTITATLVTVTGATATALDLSTAAATANRAALCVKDSAGIYNFYSVLLEQ
jgi:hypothetical protein